MIALKENFFRALWKNIVFCITFIFNYNKRKCVIDKFMTKLEKLYETLMQ